MLPVKEELIRDSGLLKRECKIESLDEGLLAFLPFMYEEGVFLIRFETKDPKIILTHELIGLLVDLMKMFITDLQKYTEHQIKQVARIF